MNIIINGFYDMQLFALETGTAKVWCRGGFQPKHMWFEVKANIIELKAYSRSSQKGTSVWSEVCVCLVLTPLTVALTEEAVQHRLTRRSSAWLCYCSVFAQYVVCVLYLVHECPVYLKCPDHLIHLPKCTLHNKVHCASYCIPHCVHFGVTFPVWWINHSDCRISE